MKKSTPIITTEVLRSTTTPNPELIVASPGREPFEILVGLGNHPSTPIFTTASTPG